MNQFRHLLITAGEYSSRRSILAEKILRKFTNKNHMIILGSSDVQYQTKHIPRPYHQDPFFYYYTGFMHKKSVLIMNIKSDQITSTLFIDKPTSQDILWNGSYPSKEDALAISGVDYIEYGDEWRNSLMKSVKDRDVSYIWSSDCNNCQMLSNEIKAIENIIPIMDVAEPSEKQRVIKSPSELKIMRVSAKMTSRALQRTMSYTRPGINEHELLGKLCFELSRFGGKLAYPPVIGGGARANIIHYLEGDRFVNDSELVLVDVGADVLGYYSDVTRTWPVNGRFTAAQATLYDILHSVHSDCVRACTSDKSLNDLLTFMMKRMSSYLIQEGVIKDPKTIHRICPHHIGHYLGLDIHDTPSVSTNIPLAPGMVFPLEPGLYFPEDCHFVDPMFRGIGMRLEDDYAMTEAGTAECLTADLGRSRADIEALCRSADDETDGGFQRSMDPCT